MPARQPARPSRGNGAVSRRRPSTRNPSGSAAGSGGGAAAASASAGTIASPAGSRDIAARIRAPCRSAAADPARSRCGRASRHQRFDRLVDRAVARIPQPFRAALDEIALVIADEPAPEQLRENGLGPTRPCTACTRACRSTSGAATGSRSRRGSCSSGCPLEEDFPDPDDLADEVRITILHELAHHLGIEDEDRLAELGID